MNQLIYLSLGRRDLEVSMIKTKEDLIMNGYLVRPDRIGRLFLDIDFLVLTTVIAPYLRISNPLGCFFEVYSEDS